jgi:hypothetical protein
MDNNNSFLAKSVNVIRWITRIFSLLAVLFVLIFEVAEAFGNDNQGGSPIPAIMILATVMMMGGLLAAWKWDFWGGLISLTGFFMVAENNPRVRELPLMYILFMAPAVLFIICGLVRRFFLKTEAESKNQG